MHADRNAVCTRILAGLFVLLLAGCIVPGGGDPHPADTKTKNDLTQALADENAYYSTHFVYTDRVSDLTAIDATLDGHALIAIVGSAQDGGDESLICLSEQSTTGTRFNVAYVNRGVWKGGPYENKGGDCSDPYVPVIEGAWNTGW
jgi:hypothetical protein